MAVKFVNALGYTSLLAFIVSLIVRIAISFTSPPATTLALPSLQPQAVNLTKPPPTVVQTKPPNSKQAYVTWLNSPYSKNSTDLASVIFWVRNLQRVGVTRHIVVMVSGEAKQYKRELKKTGAVIRDVDPVVNVYATALSAPSYTLLRLWELEEYERIVYMDYRLLVLSSEVENLFRYRPFAAPKAFVEPSLYYSTPYFIFSNATMVIQPSRKIAKEFQETFEEFPWLVEGWTTTATDYLNWFFTLNDHYNIIHPRYCLDIVAYNWTKEGSSSLFVPYSVTQDVVSVYLSHPPWQAEEADSDNKLALERVVGVYEKWWSLYHQLLPNGTLSRAYTYTPPIISASGQAALNSHQVSLNHFTLVSFKLPSLRVSLALCLLVVLIVYSRAYKLLHPSTYATSIKVISEAPAAVIRLLVAVFQMVNSTLDSCINDFSYLLPSTFVSEPVDVDLAEIDWLDEERQLASRLESPPQEHQALETVITMSEPDSTPTPAAATIVPNRWQSDESPAHQLTFGATTKVPVTISSTTAELQSAAASTLPEPRPIVFDPIVDVLSSLDKEPSTEDKRRKESSRRTATRLTLDRADASRSSKASQAKQSVAKENTVLPIEVKEEATDLSVATADVSQPEIVHSLSINDPLPTSSLTASNSQPDSTITTLALELENPQDARPNESNMSNIAEAEEPRSDIITTVVDAAIEITPLLNPTTFIDQEEHLPQDSLINQPEQLPQDSLIDQPEQLQQDSLIDQPEQRQHDLSTDPLQQPIVIDQDIAVPVTVIEQPGDEEEEKEEKPIEIFSQTIADVDLSSIEQPSTSEPTSTHQEQSNDTDVAVESATISFSTISTSETVGAAEDTSLQPQQPIETAATVSTETAPVDDDLSTNL